MFQDITEDNVSEGTEQFSISFLVDPTTINTTRITSDPNVATIFIQDNDSQLYVIKDAIAQ